MHHNATTPTHESASSAARTPRCEPRAHARRTTLTQSTQYTLHLVDEPKGRRPAPEGGVGLLAPFVENAEQALANAGNLRTLLDCPDDELARHGVRRHEIAMLRAALALGRNYIEAGVERGKPLQSPADTRRALTSRLRDLPHEIFLVLFLDNRHRIIADEVMFRGTIDGASVYPREVVKACLQHNAAAVVCAHNHPSGVAEPSRSDRAITKRLQEALALVSVRLIDHFVIGDGETASFAERGWL